MLRDIQETMTMPDGEIPITEEAIEEEFQQEIEDREDGRVYQLMFAMWKMNNRKIERLIQYVKWMVPTIVSILGVSVAIATYLAP